MVLATHIGERSALMRIGQSLAAIVVETTPIQQETRRIVKRVAIVDVMLAGTLAIAYGIAQGE